MGDDRFRQEGEPTLGPGQYEALTAFDGNRLAKSFGTSFVAYLREAEHEAPPRLQAAPLVLEHYLGHELSPGALLCTIFERAAGCLQETMHRARSRFPAGDVAGR